MVLGNHEALPAAASFTGTSGCSKLFKPRCSSERWDCFYSVQLSSLPLKWLSKRIHRQLCAAVLTALWIQAAPYSCMHACIYLMKASASSSQRKTCSCVNAPRSLLTAGHRDPGSWLLLGYMKHQQLCGSPLTPPKWRDTKSRDLLCSHCRYWLIQRILQSTSRTSHPESPSTPAPHIDTTPIACHIHVAINSSKLRRRGYGPHSHPFL